MAWRLAPTIVRLRSEVNGRWPLRDKTSDGTLGNTAHQGGTSDHNPDARGVVCAMDFDEDLSGNTGTYPRFKPGQGARAFVDRLLELARAGKLPQLYYVIYERQIFSRTNSFRARPYSGTNAHDHHVHVSVNHSPRLADRTTPWGIGVPPTPDEGDDDMPTPKEIWDVDITLGPAENSPAWYMREIHKIAKASSERERALPKLIEDALAPIRADLAAIKADLAELAELDDEPPA